MTRKIAIIGLGYAGLHTAIAFGLINTVIGFDIDQQRIRELQAGVDRHKDFTSETINKTKIVLTSNPQDITTADFYIVIVPTPIKKGNEPDFSYLISASRLLGPMLKRGDIVVYESTVYPGATEEICLPVLEKESDLKFGEDFFIGYSPERINPGDKEHTINNTIKVVSGSDTNTLKIIADEYRKVINAGVFKASSIKTAETVKIVENIQRDTNIALINELSQLFHGLDVDTDQVIDAAKTKWNFLPFHPGLVGGHCISVDPYYLLYKANELNNPLEIISAARNVNEHMSKYIASEAVKLLVRNKVLNEDTKIALLGITFKENHDDIRNSEVVEVGKELETYGIKVFYHDPIANLEEVKKEYGIELTPFEKMPKVSGVIIAVAHDQYKDITPSSYSKLLVKNGILMDLKSILNRENFSQHNVEVWRL